MIFGIFLNSLALAQATFGVVNQNGNWWFTTPDHKPFWSFGVDCVDQGETQKEWKPDNPGFASYRLFNSPEDWATTTTKNLEDWGFNSLGGWSDYADLERLDPKANIPFFVVLHLGAYAQAPFHDIFAEQARTAMQNAARDQIPKLKDNPNLVGYFTDNELGWWGDTLFISYLAMPNSAPGKQRIMACIRRFYKNDFEQLQKDWITTAAGFDAVAAQGKLKLRPVGHGIDLVNAWLTEMGTYYYAFVRDAVRTYDKHHLILGDRYCQFYEIPIAQASRDYTDVTSTNFGATWNDGTFAHFFLDGLHQLTGHPIVITEFYMGATENRSRNKNTPAAFPIVQTQQQRATAFEKNIRGLAGLPYVIGAHWFQYYDEPPKGRGDGENFNHGLVDTAGRPYELMIAASKAANPSQLHAHLVILKEPKRLKDPSPREVKTNLVILREPKRPKDLSLRPPTPREVKTNLVILREPQRPKDLYLQPPTHREVKTNLVILREPKRPKDLYPHTNLVATHTSARTTFRLQVQPNAQTPSPASAGEGQGRGCTETEKVHSNPFRFENVAKDNPHTIPQAPQNPLTDLKLWPRDAGFIPPDKGLDFGDLYVCRDDNALYLGVIAMDYADPHLYEGDQIPLQERMQWTIRLNADKPIHIRLGDDHQKAVCDNPTLQLSELHGLQHICLARIPYKVKGLTINLTSSISTHSRAYSMTWHTPLIKRQPPVMPSHAMRFSATPSARPLRISPNPPSTRFHLINEHGIDWLARPDGSKLLSRGVCVVDRGFNPKNFDPKNPGYASYRYYLTPDEWAADALNRIQDWGFNTVGAWSDTATLLKPTDPKIVFTPILHMGSGAGAPWRDMWDPKIVGLMDQIARTQIQPLAHEPRIVGYFSDNEMGWWYGAMWDWAFKAGTHSRQHLVALLKTRYRTWHALNKDFDPAGAASFEDLKTKGKLYLRPGAKGIETVKAWMSLVSDRYYSLCRHIIKKYDPGALYLGDRYISNFYPEIAASAGKYCDIVSTNLNADTQDGAFAPFYLNALHRITGRPIMITEYYEAAEENRSGNQNNSSGFPVLPTQRGRAIAFKRQTETLLRTPHVVGAHWFQYYDEPMHGRGDGENYDMGLVDIDNRPYEQLTDASRAIDANAIHRQGPRDKPTSAKIPTFSDSSLDNIDVWINRGRLMTSLGLVARGDLYLAQNRGHLYACLYWNEDLFPEAFYRDGKIPAADEPKLQIFAKGQETDVTLPSKGVPIVQNGKAIAHKWGVRNYVILRLPGDANKLGLAANLTTRSRAYDMTWLDLPPTSKRAQPSSEDNFPDVPENHWAFEIKKRSK